MNYMPDRPCPAYVYMHVCHAYYVCSICTIEITDK